MHGGDYGRLVVPWDENSAHRSDHIEFPRARLIIEAQSLLMSFLRKVVDLLLENVSYPPSTPLHLPMENGCGNPRRGRPTGIGKWSQYLCQPFSGPPKFDIDGLVSQARARVEAIGDHLWHLQTEATYL